MGIHIGKQENKNSTKKTTKKKRKNFLFFLITFLIEFLFSFFFFCFLVFLLSRFLLSIPTSGEGGRVYQTKKSEKVKVCVKILIILFFYFLLSYKYRLFSPAAHINKCINALNCIATVSKMRTKACLKIPLIFLSFNSISKCVVIHFLPQ